MRAITTQRWTTETSGGTQTEAWTWQLAEKNTSCTTLAEALAPLSDATNSEEESIVTNPAAANQPTTIHLHAAQPSRATAPAMAVLMQSPLIAFLLFVWRSVAGRLRRIQAVPARPSMQVIGYLSLGGRRTLALVEIEGQQYLIGGSADQVSTIVAVSPGAVPANATGTLAVASAAEEVV